MLDFRLGFIDLLACTLSLRCTGSGVGNLFDSVREAWR